MENGSTAGGGEERLGEIGGAGETVDGNEQRTQSAGAEERLRGGQRAAFEPVRLHAGSGQRRARRAEPRRMRLVACDLERAPAIVEGPPAGVGRDALDERVVGIEAALAERGERFGAVSFDVRRQHSGRRLRGAARRTAHVDHPHAGPGRRQLPRHGRADHAGADDEDVRR